METDFVIEMHDDLIASYGGATGLREASLLSSALAQVDAVKQFSQPSLYDLAATYCYHLCQNHPFVDGNKRTACAVTLVFLALSDIAIIAHYSEIVKVMRDVAGKQMNKKDLTEWLEDLTWDTTRMDSYELPLVYKEVKKYHGDVFRVLATL